MKMYAEILFDREIDKNKHYVSPGSYQVLLKNGRSIYFDFDTFYGNVSDENPRVLECEMCGLDTVSFPEAKDFNPKDMVSIQEFFVFTGEYDEPEIHPVKLLSLEFSVDDMDYPVPEHIVKGARVTDGFEQYSLFILSCDETYDNETIGAEDAESVIGVPPSVYQVPTVRMDEIHMAAKYAHDMFHLNDDGDVYLAELFELYLKNECIPFHLIGNLNLPFTARTGEYLSKKVEMHDI